MISKKKTKKTDMDDRDDKKPSKKKEKVVENMLGKKIILVLPILAFLLAMPITLAAPPSGYSNRINITISSSASAIVTNGNVPQVNVSINVTNLSAAGVLQSDYDDIYFTMDADSDVRLPHWIEVVNPNGLAIIWVKPTNITNTNTTKIYLFHGNAGAANGQNESGLYDSNYLTAAYSTEGTSTKMHDSTVNKNNFTTNGGWTTGIWGNATSYTEQFAYSIAPIAASPSQTYEIWAYPTSWTTAAAALMSIGNISGGDTRQWFQLVDTTMKFKSMLVNGSESNENFGDLPTDRWIYTAIVRNTTHSVIYYNGTQKLTTPYGNYKNESHKLYLMTHYINNPTDYNVNGNIDVVKVSNTSRSSDYVKLSYDIPMKGLVAIGGSETLSGGAGGTPNSLTLNAPTNSTYTQYSMQVNYTPIFYNGAIKNCSIRYANNSLVAWNTSGISNNSVNMIGVVFADDRSHDYKMRCYNASAEYFESSDVNFTIAAPIILNASIDKPTNDASIFQNNNFTLNGTIFCPSGNCGNVFIFPRYQNSSTSSTITETSNDDFYDGQFGNLPSLTMNSSNSIKLVSDFSKILKSSNNPTLSTGVIDTANAGTTGFYNSTNGNYYVLYQCLNSGIWKTCLAYTADLTASVGSWTKCGIVLDANASNAFMSGGTAPAGLAWNPNTNVFDFYFLGYNGFSTTGYANFTGISGCSIQNLKVHSSAVFTAANLCEAPSAQETMQVKNWIEGTEEYATALCSYSKGSTAANYRIYMVNLTDSRTSFTKLQTVSVMNSTQVGHDEIQNSGMQFFKYNSTHKIYLQPTGWIDETYGAIELEYSFDRLTWYIWNGGTDIVPRGPTYDNYRAGVNDWLWNTDGKLQMTYMNVPVNGDGTNLNISTASFNFTNGFYMSDVKDLLSSTTISTATWTNTTCVNCNIGVQLLYSNNTTSFDATSFTYTGSATWNKNARYIKYNVSLTGNNTDSPTFDSITINYGSVGASDMYNTSSEFQTNVPYSCGLLNHTNQNCTWSFNVNSTETGEKNIYVIANSTSVTNSSSNINISIVSGILPSSVHLYLNGTEGNKTYTFGEVTNATGVVQTPSDGVGLLYRNGTYLTEQITQENPNDVYTSPSNEWLFGANTSTFDGNWDTRGICGNSTMTANCFVYENYTIPENTISALIKVRYSIYISSDNPSFNVSCYNYTSSSWYQIYSNFTDTSGYINKTLNIPTSCMNEKIMQKTELTSYHSNTEYSEGQIIWNETKTNDLSNLPVGAYNYTFAYSGNATYNPSSVTYYATVNKNSSSLFLGITNNNTNYGTSTTAICIPTGDPSATITLLRNGSTVSTGTGSRAESNTLGAGIYNYTCVYSDSENYTTSSSEKNLHLNKASENLVITANSSLTGTYPYPLSLTGTGNYTVGNLYKNGTLVSSPYTTLLGAGGYNFTWNASGNANYSANSTSSIVSISKASNTPVITFNSTSPSATGTVNLITCTASGTPSLFNDTSSLTNPATETYSTVGMFNYTCNTTSTANYTTGTSSKSMTIAALGTLNINQVLDESNITKSLVFNVQVFNSTYSASVENITSYSNNIIKGEITIAISSDGYDTRYYYANVAALDYSNLTGYLLPSSIGTNKVFTIVNSYQQKVPNAFIFIERLLPTWQNVTIGYTDTGGIFVTSMDSSATYRITISKSGYDTKQISIIPALDAYSIIIGGSTQAGSPSYWDYYKNFQGGCSFDNSTRNLTCTWNSTLNVTNTNLNVIQRNSTMESTLCSSSKNSSNGTIVCSFGEPNNKTFRWSSDTVIGPDTFPIDSGTWTDNRPSVNLGMNGLIVCLLITLAAGMIGVMTGNPVIVVLLTAISVAACALTGFLSLGESALTVVIGLIVSAGILMYKMRNG